jgi:hypothetical protein
MTRKVIQFVGVMSLMVAGCDGVCLTYLPICGLTVNVTGLAAQESVTVSVQADHEVQARTFSCAVQASTCSHFFQDYVPPKVNVRLEVGDSVITRTYIPAAVKSSTGCPSCTGGVINVAL